MYVIHPKKLIYLANPKTGSTSFGMYWLRERFNFADHEGRHSNGAELQVCSASEFDPRWGNHHGMDLKYFEQLKAQGYTSFTVIRNPWDHMVSWYHGSGRSNIDFRHFVHHFDEIVHYTWPEKYPGNMQILTEFSDRVARFENLEPDLSEIMGEKVELGTFNECRNRKPYPEYYKGKDEHLIEIVRDRNKDFLLDFPYEF